MKKECGIHPERTAAVCQEDFELGEINRDIVNVNRVAIFITRARKDRRPGVEHNRDAISLGCPINDFEFFNSMQIIVWKQQLMRRVNLDHAQAKAQNVLDIRHDVGGVPRMQAATGDQTFGIILRVVGDELIDGGRKADDFRRHIIDQSGPVDAATVQIFQKGFWRAAILGNFIEVGALAL